jgi:hypothetical protein
MLVVAAATWRSLCAVLIAPSGGKPSKPQVRSSELLCYDNGDILELRQQVDDGWETAI